MNGKQETLSNADKQFLKNLLAVNERVAANLRLSDSAAQVAMDKIGETLYEDELRRGNEETQEFWRQAL